MKRTEIKDLLQGKGLNETVCAKGWVRTKRESKNVAFIALNDGSTIHNIQIVVDFNTIPEENLADVHTGASLSVTGKLIESAGKGQKFEILAENIEVMGKADPDEYPLQPKRHSLEFLREIAHLRFRTNTFGAVFRVRHALAYAIHKYFNDRGFYYIHTPIITGSDAEGAGEMFEATTLNLLKIPLKSLENKDKIKYKNIFIDIEKKYIEDIEKLGYINDITESLKHINFKDITIKELLTRNPEEIIKNTYNDYIKSNFSDHFFEIANEKSFKSLINKLKDELNEKLLKEKVKIEFNKRKYNKSKHPYLYYNIYNILNPKLKKVDYKQDFFGKPTNLTVSGQLEAELAALALSKVYTFGPTFRAENSNTTRHLAEFWMIEPEIAFADLDDDMDLAEDLLKYCIGYVLENCKDDLQFLSKRQQDEEKQKPQNERSMELFEKLNFILKEPFERLTYTEAIEILRNSKPNKKGKFQYPVEGFGTDLQSEHERYLVEKHFKKPVILTDYPAEIKAFYMRLNEDGKTVRAMDILFPGIGEIVGGSQREERYEVLLEKVKQFNIPEEELWWYLDTRKFGTAPHSGFGLGFERLVQFVTGMGNIRDVIPFPRTPKNAEF